MQKTKLLVFIAISLLIIGTTSMTHAVYALHNPTVPAPELNPSVIITYGESVTASIKISGTKHITPTGKVDFQVSTDSGKTYTKFGATKTLSSGFATSDSYTPAAAGSNYRFRAVYYGDSNYKGETGPSRSLTVKKASTAIKNLNCYPNPIGKTGHATTKISGNLYSGSTGIVGATIAIFYIDGGPCWTPIATVTTSVDGYFEFDWDVPDTLENGFYYIKAKFEGNDNYCGASAITCKYPLLVVPEYVLGGLLSLFACFAAFIAHKKMGLNRPK
ncbi:MAG: Ig-like domain-containing protein [Candidatus Bathyarchaeota archaeon]|nr:Ig-like domain-containing protein [Candidatus Bathyarchaeota archaeon]